MLGNDPLVLESNKAHVSKADEGFDLNESLFDVTFPKVVRAKDAQPKRDARKERATKKGSIKKRRAVKEADDVKTFGGISARLDTLDDDFKDLRNDLNESLFDVTFPKVVRAKDPQPKRDARKKRTNKRGSIKKRRAVKEADDVKTFGEISARLDTLDDDFKDLRNDIDAFDVKLKAVVEELERSLRVSA